MQTVVEIITHFIGLFRVLDDPVRTWAKPDGAGENHAMLLDEAHGDQARHNVDAVKSDPSAPFTMRDAAPGADPHLHAWKGSLQRLPDVPHAPIASPRFAAPQSPSIDGGGDPTPRSVATTTIVVESGPDVVWRGADQTVVDDHQVNVLIANTSLVDHLGEGPLPIPNDALLPGLIAQSYAAVPHDAPPLGQSDTQEVGLVKAFEDGLATGSVAPLQSLQQGTYTDGVRTSSDGTPAPLTLPVTQLNTTTPTAEGAPLGQSIKIGHDVVGNVALIVDTSAAPLTQIVQGNAFHADLIIQSTVVQNIDQVSITASAMVPGAILSDGNTIHNTAHFEQLATDFSATVTGSFAQHWNVQVVDGDFYDINAITQQNILINNALYASTPMTDHYYAVLGGNTQLNQASFIHDAPSYDLLIVLGNSYSANAIYQQNILLNDTKTGVEVSPSNGGVNTVMTGHNIVTNEAEIVEYGTHKWNPTTPELQTLVHELTTTGDFLGSFPGLASFGGTIRVELVTGNYYNFNLISQTNIVANSSITLADLTKAGFQVPTSVTIGLNTLTNSAAIVAAGPLEQQYVAGNPYETGMLVQSNIVVAHTEVSAASTGKLVPELVAFLDPANAHDVVGSAPLDHAALPTTSAAQQDVLSGHLH